MESFVLCVILLNPTMSTIMHSWIQEISSGVIIIDDTRSSSGDARKELPHSSEILHLSCFKSLKKIMFYLGLRRYTFLPFLLQGLDRTGCVCVDTDNVGVSLAQQDAVLCFRGHRCSM